MKHCYGLYSAVMSCSDEYQLVFFAIAKNIFARLVLTVEKCFFFTNIMSYINFPTRLCCVECVLFLLLSLLMLYVYVTYSFLSDIC